MLQVARERSSARTAPAVGPRALLLTALCSACTASHRIETAEEFVDALEAALCARSARCEAPRVLPAPPFCAGGHFFDSRREAGRRGDVLLDTEAAEECLRSLAELPCRSSEPAPPSAAGACRSALVPTLEEGTACVPADVLGCRDGYCAGSSACIGACAPAPIAGETCATRDCGDGSVCGFGPPAECRATLRPIGAPCSLDDECSAIDPTSGAQRASICLAGVCAVAGAVGAGQACGAHVADCAEDLPCVEGTCRPLAALGAACAPTMPCVASARCDGGLCRERATVGEPCAGDADCATSAPYCHGPDPGAATCQLDADGIACSMRASSIYGPDLDPCPSGLLCVEYACRRPVALGASCEAGRPCDVGARCVAGTCRAVVPLGGTCDGDACVTGTVCIDHRCARAPDVGESCTEACRHGSCVTGRCELLADGADCTDRASSCAGSCSGGVCVPASGPGEPCGLGVARCAHGLLCVGDEADIGTCVAARCVS